MTYTYIITAASIVGTVANIYRRRFGFVLWFLTDVFWCAYDITIAEYSQAVLWGVYALLAAWGWWRWRKG
jgi:nicotinamide riboside transporter PnuC